MSLTSFGLYLIPEDGKFYSDGSAVAGYDIRRQKTVTPPHFIESSWISNSQVYGFHATITDAIYVDDSEVPQIAQRVKELLACFRPTNVYTLTKTRVGFWRPNSDQAAIHFAPNRNIELLHDVLVAIVHPLGKGSEYLDRYKNDTAHYLDASPSQVKKTKQFYSPYIFEEFAPHFTCINPFAGTPEQRQRLEGDLERLFADVDEVQFRKLAMAVKAPSEAHYRIVAEFDLHPSAS